MESYKAETAEILKRFLARKISYGKCIAALDAALAEAILRIDVDLDLPAVRGVMLDNHTLVLKEMRRRKTKATDST